jgi:hypothetical protein|tara:strand:+ start:458 stop:592 length:135 start_codon:yes stop_codon:yes gene_type:complete
LYDHRHAGLARALVFVRDWERSAKLAVLYDIEKEVRSMGMVERS